ncbi:NBR1-Ig-like domain-containing protein [Rugamonas apoptosis]|uniref:Uncharacterized protein n=1 Tax=Rugamonas apoptosis TaxID=2758570 RepID=A0A7W2IMN2_9BURK|nr:NBR1-Ig-like domain-containing protein [Rugamonas apoptosis]MBA5689970.1 hypothetical protein [Rugamonas apoptosis]
MTFLPMTTNHIRKDSPRTIFAAGWMTLLWRLALTFLLGGAAYPALATIYGAMDFISLTPPAGGMAPAGGTLAVEFPVQVKANREGEAVKTVSLMEQGVATPLSSRDFTIQWDQYHENPVNAVRNPTMAANLSIGRHELYIRAIDADGGSGDSPHYIVVVTGPGNGAQLVRQSSPPANMTAGQSYTVSVTMKNTGGTTWTAQGSKPYSLGSVGDNGAWGMGRVGLGGNTVAPGQEYTFSFTITAPARAGTYNYRWQMVQDGEAWFGDMSTAPTSVDVSAPVPVNGAQFVRQSAPPTTMATGQSYNVAVTMRNTGTTTWTAQGSNPYSLGSVDENGAWRITRVGLGSNTVAPGQEYTFKFAITAPAQAGTYKYQWQMVQELIAWFGDKSPAPTSITVNTPVLPPPTVTIVSPANDARFLLSSGNSYALPITVQVAGNGGATIRTQEVLDGGTPIPATFNGASGMVQLAPGQHSLQLRVTDSNGSSATSSPAVKVSIDVPPPGVTLTTPATNVTVVSTGTTAQVAVAGSATSVGGVVISRIDLLDNDGVIDSVNGGTYSQTRSLSAGVHKLALVATAGGQTKRSNEVRVEVVPGAMGDGAKFISQTAPSVMRAGQPYTVTVVMLNNGTTTWTPGGANPYRLGAQGPQDNRNFRNLGRVNLAGPVAPGQQATFTFPVSAPLKAGAYTLQWQMVVERLHWFGDLVTPPQTIQVMTGAGPGAKLSVTPSNVRASIAAPAQLTFSGNGAEIGRTITQLQLFEDNDTTGDFSPVPLTTQPGSGSSVDFHYTLARPPGVYWYRLRAIDDQGIATDSAPVVVNVTDGTLLGAVSGVRIDANNKPQLVGWGCQSGVSQALSYQVLLDGPTPGTGGVLLISGTAGLATEPDNAAVQAQCGTPGSAHHFNVDLSAYTAQYSGRTLFVMATAPNGTTKATLPCGDNTCTMPGSLRIAMTTPTNGVQISSSTLFMRAQVSGGSGPFDEVAFGVDDAWTNGNPDGAVNAYSTSKSGLLARAAPYVVQARVRQGNVTLYSPPNLVTVLAASPTTISLSSPADGTTVSVGGQVNLSATAGGDVAKLASVKFYANGQLIGDGVANGNSWTAVWRNVQAGSYVVLARAYDGSGVQLAQSGNVTVSVSTGSTGSSDTPIAVVLQGDQPPLGNTAGTLPGSLGVSATGAATYSIELVVPPGTAGIQPKLALNYNGDAVNGPLGLGWSLEGFSSIHRCGKTMAQDGVNDRIAFDNADRLCLDGQRLVLVNLPVNDDNYWSPSAEYRTEIDSFSRITTQVGTNGKRSFTLEAKDGRVLTFGSTSSSYVKAIVGHVNSGTVAAQPSAKNGALSWALDRVVDRFGNFVNYSYAQDEVTGEHLPKSITYGGAGLPAHAAVVFTFTGRDDAWTRYVDEARNDLRHRLSDIYTYVGDNLDANAAASGTVVRHYALSYEKSPTSGRSLLNAVQVSARNPQSNVMEPLPATTFAWGKPDPSKHAGFESKGIWAGAPLLTKHDSSVGNYADYFTFADFENHGYTDVLEKRVAPERPAADAPPTDPQSNNQTGLPPGTMRSTYNYYHNTGSGFSHYTYQLNTGENFVVLDVGDFDGDGAPDLLVETGGAAKMCLSPLGRSGALGAPGSVITFVCQSWTATGANETKKTPFVVDVNGDGRSAHYGPILPGGSALLCSASGCVTDTNPPPTLMGAREEYMNWRFAYNYAAFTTMVDFAGMGKTYDVRATSPKYTDKEEGNPVHIWDNLVPTLTVTGFPKPGTARSPKDFQNYRYPAFAQLPGNGQSLAQYSFDLPSSGGNSADFNGSGYSGLIFGYFDTSRDPHWTTAAGINPTDLTLCLSTGRALDCAVRKKYSGSQYVRPHAVGNFVGDGQATVLVESLVIQSPIFSPTGNGRARMCSIMGDDTTQGQGTNDANMNCVDWSGVTLPTMAAPGTLDNEYFMDLLGTGRPQLVYYHAGKFVGGTWQEDGRWEVFAPIDVAYDKQALDRIVSVTNGLGSTSAVEYVDGLPSGVVSQSGHAGFSYPLHAVGSTGKVVSRLRAGNGVSSERTVRYRYLDAVADLSGRGTHGYAQIESTDEQTGIVTTDHYRLDWPYSGMLSSSTVVSGEGGGLSDTQNRLGSKRISQANGVSTDFPSILGSTVVRKDLDGSDLGSVTTAGATGTDIQYDDWGNLLNSKTTSVGSLVNPGASFVNQIVNSYYPADTSRWLVGQLQRSVVAADQSVAGGALSRTKSYTHDPEKGYLLSEVVEPDDPKLAVTTRFERNGFGLVKSRVISWMDPASNTTMSRTERTDYEPKGRYPASLNNALNQQEQRSYDAGSGAQTGQADVNQLWTRWTVDGYGRVLTETRPDQNQTRLYRNACACGGPAGTVTTSVSEHYNGAQRAAVPTISYSDSAGHVLRTKSYGFDGRAIVADRRYDGLGRLWEADQSHYATDTAYLAQRLGYDALGRVTKAERPDEGGATVSDLTEYHGLRTVRSNARRQQRTELRDVLGRTERVLDALQHTSGFSYDPFGNLVSASDPNHNVVRMRYDLLGRKTELNDPDLGQIRYDVDPLGQTWRQSSPEQRKVGQVVTFEYDALGRMTARLEPSLSSHWIYDTAAHGVGRLAEAYAGTAQDKRYQRLHEYDELGRAQATREKRSDADYVSTLAYDAWGRLVSRGDQRGTDPASLKRYGLRYNGYGYLARLERGALVLWQADAQDAAGRITQATLGNGLVQMRDYSPYTGWLRNSLLKTAALLPRLVEGYQYDALGNVSTRTQAWNSVRFEENFKYDDLNRLHSSQLVSKGQAEQIYGYDDAGNLTGKPGVGAYDYGPQGEGAVRPHALHSLGGQPFAYDDNGNLKQGGGRGISWTSFDMPDTITKGAFSSAFTYGPEHQRTRQVRRDARGQSTVTYAGAQEAEQAADGMLAVKTYWPLGVGVEIDRTGAATELDWTHADRLGSVVAITGPSGELKEMLAYDSWGKRRTPDGGSSDDNVDGVLDNKGYTGHEMLDQLDLVHMNGRVYDPATARFLSGDPIVKDPVNGQDFNRYSYVVNNPTNLTDPTGFERQTPRDVLAAQIRAADGFVTVYSIANATSTGGGTTSTFDVDESTVGNPSRGQQSKQGGANWSANNDTKYTFTTTQTTDPVFGTPIVTSNAHKVTNYADQAMGDFVNLNLAERGARGLGASERQAFWIGLGVNMIGNPKQAFTSVARKTAGQLGREGEAAVRALYNIGEKEAILINGRTRIPDGLTQEALSEVKNVQSLSATSQLRDYLQYAESNGLRFDLYTRPDTKLSGPLQQLIMDGRINLIPVIPK